MDLVDKAKIRLEHWIVHNDHHNEDYEKFAAQLEEAGKAGSATYVREMIDLTVKGNECLKKALDALL